MLTNEELIERVKECQKIADKILQERGLSKTFRSRLDLNKFRIVIEEYYKVHNSPTEWHFVCDFIFQANNEIVYWSCGSTSLFYDFSVEQFEKLMRNAGNYHIV